MTNLPPERLVLAFGLGIAAVAYVYWTAVGIDRGEGWTGVPSMRALVALGGAGVLALLLRLIRSIDES